MKIYKYPEQKDWQELLKRPVFDTSELDGTVRMVLEDIKANGDIAVKKYTEQFDKVTISDLYVSANEIEEAVSKVSDKLKSAIDIAYTNIYNFHKAQKTAPVHVEVSTGIDCWQKPVAIEKVGLYIPGGTAPLFSTVLMLAIPAQIAGCKEIVLCTPPSTDGSIHPVILYCAKKTGITKVFKAGGIQAIGAMAYGTETVPAVYKIFGPGNQYVTAAKQLVARDKVAIDMPAGPSEVAVLGDDTSNPVFIAYDLLSQAEHGKDSQVIFITTSEDMLNKVNEAVSVEVEKLPRKEFAKAALENSRLILVKDEDEMMLMMNEYAPEHLIISTNNADD
ncbi:MAG: histidinol dehydrogenase, partial [Bacteroidales bacterium]|nr:histidinol dehydrogenase [Bacteroidales bacterium]